MCDCELFARASEHLSRTIVQRRRDMSRKRGGIPNYIESLCEIVLYMILSEIDSHKDEGRGGWPRDSVYDFK
jgi:hypothetical protein